MRLHDRHLDEAEFMFELFEAALDAPSYDLGALERGPERRLWAHVDGLIIAGQDACGRSLVPVLGEGEHGRARVGAATLALAELPLLADSSGGRDALARLRPPVPTPIQTWSRIMSFHDACDAPERAEAMIRGLALSSTEALLGWAQTELAGSLGGRARSGRVRLLVERGVAPQDLAALLSDEDPQLVALAVEAARASTEASVLAELAELGQSADAGVREAAIESALIHGIPGAWASALFWAQTPEVSPLRSRAWIWLALLGDAEVHGWLIAALATAAEPEPLLWALGFCGRPAAVDAALDWLDHDALGPLAAEIVVAIAGLGLDEAGCWELRVEPSEGQALPELATDALDAELVPSSSAALPRPRPEGIRAWWQGRRDHASFDRRYLGGRELGPAVALEALARAPLRRRHVLALELALRSGGQLQLMTRQTTRRQRRQLADFAAQPSFASLDFQRGLGRG